MTTASAQRELKFISILSWCIVIAGLLLSMTVWDDASIRMAVYFAGCLAGITLALSALTFGQRTKFVTINASAGILLPIVLTLLFA